MTDPSDDNLRERHDDYAERVNLAVAEDREDIVDALSTRFAAADVGQRPSRVPGADPAGRSETPGERAHGPLPILLVGLTFVTGLVDAFSYLSLGQVFVANMTGNVVFIGFGLAGVGRTSVVASLVAVLAFTLGAAAGGRWSRLRAPHRGRLLAVAAAGQTVLVVVAAIVALMAGVTGTATRLVLVALLAVAMGGQNAVARRLAVPDLTTTVLTLTVTGLVADATTSKVRIRRIVPVAAMLIGALAGGALLRWVDPTAPLWLATAVLMACGVAAHLAHRRPQSEAWH